jgi:hypothetical protein
MHLMLLFPGLGGLAGMVVLGIPLFILQRRRLHALAVLGLMVGVPAVLALLGAGLIYLRA